MGATDQERQAKIELQKRIQNAVIADKGWESIPPELRAQADSAWFRSLLLFDPAKVMPKIKQPILIIQGDLDQQVFPHHADRSHRWRAPARRRRPSKPLHLPGINHLLVPATTGDVSEYGSLPDKTITPAVAKTRSPTG